MVSVFVQLLRGSKKSPSVVGIARCSAVDNVILGAFLTISVLVVVYEIKRVKRRQFL